LLEMLLAASGCCCCCVEADMTGLRTWLARRGSSGTAFGAQLRGLRAD
jgi:hypothetical protein